MPFGHQVERWRALAAELARGMPVDLVLGVIWKESRGVPGVLGGRKTRCANIPSEIGPRWTCRALGLMQIVPKNVARWNTAHPLSPVSYEQMTGTSTAAARTQIKLGIAFLRDSLAWLKQYGFGWPGAPLSDEQIKIGLMTYAWGPGNLGPYLDELEHDQVAITAGAIAARWPDLGKPQNQPIVYSRLVWNKAFGAGGIMPGPAPPKRSSDGLGWGILAIAALAAFATSR